MDIFLSLPLFHLPFYPPPPPRNVMFVSGALLAVLLGLTIYDEDVITVEHVLTLMTLLGGLVAVCRSVMTCGGV